jgi:hypothetical protein
MNPARARLTERAEQSPHSSAAGVLRLDAVPQGLKPGSFEEPIIAALEGPLFHV